MSAPAQLRVNDLAQDGRASNLSTTDASHDQDGKMSALAKQLKPRAPRKPSTRKSTRIKLKPGQLGPGRKSVLQVPATGGYVGGCMTGKAMGQMLLKRVRGENSEMAFLTVRDQIQAFVECMEREGCIYNQARPTNWTEAQSARRGQFIAFLGVLSQWVADSVRLCGADLDLLTEAKLLEQASAGLNFDFDAWVRQGGGES